MRPLVPRLVAEIRALDGRYSAQDSATSAALLKFLMRFLVCDVKTGRAPDGEAFVPGLLIPPGDRGPTDLPAESRLLPVPLLAQFRCLPWTPGSCASAWT